MNASLDTTSSRAGLPLLPALVALAGLIHLATGLALLLAPAWFYQNIGTFPPFNRHYAGDLGAFELGLGLALLPAARHPGRHWLLLAAVAAANLLHALNHAYDALLLDAPLAYWAGDLGPLLLTTAVLGLVALAAWRDARGG